MSHFRKVESADPVMTKTEKDKVKWLDAQTLIINTYNDDYQLTINNGYTIDIATMSSVNIKRDRLELF